MKTLPFCDAFRSHGARWLAALAPVIGLVMLLSLGGRSGAAFAADAAAGTPAAPSPTLVRVQTTAGTFVIQLNAARAPLTVANFLQYVRDGFYDGTLVHRVVEGFLIQAGGYTPNYEPKPVRPPIPNESGNGLSNTRGTVGLARIDDPHSGNSQFFINLGDNSMLDPQSTRWGYTVFGNVVQGMEVLEQMSHVATYTGDGKTGPLTDSVPYRQIIIERVTIEGTTAAAADKARGK